MLEAIGATLERVGLMLIPYSFAMYFPVRWLEYAWRFGYHRLIKSIWYLALGLMYVTSDVGVGMVVTFICFIEAWDLFFAQLEFNRERRSLQEGTPVADR